MTKTRSSRISQFTAKVIEAVSILGDVQDAIQIRIPITPVIDIIFDDVLLSDAGDGTFTETASYTINGFGESQTVESAWDMDTVVATIAANLHAYNRAMFLLTLWLRLLHRTPCKIRLDITAVTNPVTRRVFCIHGGETC